jgi:hypothetical protein
LQIATSTRVLFQKWDTLRTQRQRNHDISLRPLICSLEQFGNERTVIEHLTETLQWLETNNMKVMWRETKSLTGTPLTINGKTATTIQEKLNAFADALEETFTACSDIDHAFTVSSEQIANDFLKQPLANRVRATNHSEIAWIIRNLKPRKTSGSDGVQNIILQHLPRLLLRFIA